VTTACDTSVLVAALVSWHPRRDEARRVVQSRVTALPAHVLLETFSVLTRLPAPHRIAPDDASAAVGMLQLRPLTLPGSAHRELLPRLAAHGIRGGAVYDGLVAATAAHHGAILLSLDKRARSTYEALGVHHEIV